MAKKTSLSWALFNLHLTDMNRVPYLDLQAQYHALRGEVSRALEEICESSSFAQGQATADFEAKFAAYCGVDHCVSLNSGTSALHLALRCLNVGPGDEVVTVSMTFIATAWAISYVGATPVFVDIDPARRTLNPDKIEAAITSRTKAIIPVHLYGMPAEMDHVPGMQPCRSDHVRQIHRRWSYMRKAHRASRHNPKPAAFLSQLSGYYL